MIVSIWNRFEKISSLEWIVTLAIEVQVLRDFFLYVL